MKRTLALVGTLLLFGLAPPVAADSPETGIVLGRTVDTNGDPMPGVTVTIAGDRGEKVAITGAEGGYRFALLTPGTYTVRGTLDDYGSAETSVTVTPGARSEIVLTMALQAAGEITVTAETPLINKFEVTSAGAISSNVASNVVGVNSNYFSNLQLMPGVVSDGDLADEYPGVNGSRWQEGAVFVDGVDTTYTRRGGSRMFLPQVGVNETSLQSTTGSAEYGRATGGVVNVITKSGTNVIHGEGMVFRQQGSWVSEYQSHAELAERQGCRYRAVVNPQNVPFAPSCQPDFFKRDELEKDNAATNVQAFFGGPLVRNKLWFAASIAETNSFQTQELFSGDIVDNSVYVKGRLLKFDYQPNPSNSLQLNYNASPLDVTFVLGDFPADRYSATPHEFGGELITGSWNWSASQDIFMEFKLSAHDSSEHKRLNAGTGFDFESALAEKQQDPRYPANRLGPHSPGNNVHGYIGYRGGEWHLFNGWLLDNGFGLNDYPRDQANVRMTWFASESHEALFGLDWQEVGWEQDLQRNNVYFGREFNPATHTGFDDCGLINWPTTTYYCHYEDYNPPDLVGTERLRGTRSSNFAAFARDRFTAGDHWSFNLGLRWENQIHKNDVRRTVVDSQSISPRLLASYDIKRDGRMVVHFNLARAYQHLNQELVNNYLLEGWNGTNAYDRIVYCAPIDAIYIQVCNGPGYTGLLGKLRPGEMYRQIDAGVIPAVDIEPYYKDEIDLVYSWNLGARRQWFFQASAIHWEYKNSIGTTEQRLPNGDYFRFTENYKDYERVLGAMGVVDPDVMANFEEGKRTYQSLQLQLNKVFRNGWALGNNFTYADAKGHYWGGLFDNTNSDYGRNLDVVLNEGHIRSCEGQQLIRNGGQPVIGADGQELVRKYPLDCQAALGRFLGQPLSTINRYGTVHENNKYIWNTWGFKTWQFGQSGQGFVLGGSLQWRSGKPWQRVEGASLGQPCDTQFWEPGFELECDPTQFLVDSGTGLYLEPRGSRDAFNSTWSANMTLMYFFPLGWREDFNGYLRVDATNITDNQELLRINNGGEVSASRYIGWQRPRRFVATVGLRF